MNTNKVNRLIEDIKDGECITQMCKQKPHLILKTQCGVGKYVFSNITYKGDKLVLELIAIDYMKNKEDYEINLIFTNNAHIALTTETIEVRLEDQNEIIN